MLNTTFDGILSKLQEKGGDGAHTQLSIKHVSNESDFFSSLNELFKKDNISRYVDAPEKFKVSVSSNLKVIVEFDETEFDAILTEIKFTKKEKKGDIIFDCEIRLEKEIDDINKLLGIQYLNNKEEDEDGKLKLVWYKVKISKKEE